MRLAFGSHTVLILFLLRLYFFFVGRALPVFRHGRALLDLHFHRVWTDQNFFIGRAIDTDDLLGLI